MSGIQQLLFATKGQAGLPGVVTLSDQSLTVIGNDVALRVGYEVSNLGYVYKALVGSNVLLEQWVAPLGAAGNFEIFASTETPAYINGTLNAWMPMTVAHQWYIQANTTINQSITVMIAVTIRRVGQVTPEQTAYITLSAHKP